MWGSNRGDSLSTEENVVASIGAFSTFASKSSVLRIDAFVFEIVDADGDYSYEAHSRGVLRILRTLSDADPVRSGGCLADPRDLEGRTWHFNWNRKYFFVTTFGPCYPKEHPRHSFGSRLTFVVLQPGESFTRWRVTPKIRHAIHDAYSRAGCPIFYSRLTNAGICVPPIHKSQCGSKTQPHRWWNQAVCELE